MMRKIFTCIFGTILICTALRAQRSTYREHGPYDGLLNPGINCLLQDHLGYIWVGTENGLFRYDGDHFQRFGHAEGIENTEIHSLAESPDGVLWVGTQGGVARGTADGFETVDVGAKGVFQKIVFGSQDTLYLKYDAGVVAGTKGKGDVYRFKPLITGFGSGALLLKDGQVWLLKDQSFWRLSGTGIVRIGPAAGLPKDSWDVFCVDAAGNLWVRSFTKLFELVRGQSRFVDRSSGVPHAEFPDMKAGPDGRLLLTSGNGLILLDPSASFKTPHIDRIDHTKGLQSDVVSSVLVDRDNTLWIGLAGGGLAQQLGHGEWLSWRTADSLLNDSVWSVLHDHAGRLWVGTSGGLNIFAPDGHLAHAWTTHNGLNGADVYAIAQDSAGQVAIGTSLDSVSWFSKQGELQQTVRPDSLQKNSTILGVAFDHSGRLWAVGSFGILYRSGRPLQRGVPLHFERIVVPMAPANTYFNNIALGDDGSVWIASSIGLMHFDGAHWRVFTRSDGLRSDDINMVLLDHGSIWIAYRDALGIANLRPNGQGGLRVTNLGPKEGLSSDLAYALAVDHRGTLWISTDNGVDAVTSPLSARMVRHYDSEDGLIWNDGDDRAIYIDDSDSVWIGTSRGLSRYKAVPLVNRDRPTTVVLTSVKVGDKRYRPDQSAALPYKQNSIYFQFSTLDYSAGKNTQYRYRLLGSMKNWELTNGSSMNFAKLPPGHYTFEVIAAGKNGLWSPVSASFAFSIQPAWWQSWWFTAACLAAGILLIYALWQYRLRMLLKQTDVLEQKVAQRTEELRVSHHQLEQVAYVDALTKIPNRRKFYDEFRKQLAISRRHGVTLALVLLDLDGFKQINDTFGHDIGDEALADTARKLLSCIRESDCLGRLGGDEFAILLINPNTFSGVDIFCKHVLDTVCSDIVLNGTKRRLGCSIGVAAFPEDGDTEELLYKAADIALYQSKRNGGSLHSWHSPRLVAELRS